MLVSWSRRHLLITGADEIIIYTGLATVIIWRQFSDWLYFHVTWYSTSLHAVCLGWEVKLKVSRSIVVCVRETSSHSYGTSHAISDHTVLPATQQRWLSHLYPSRSWYSNLPPRRDAKLSWPRWWLQFARQFTCRRRSPASEIYNQAVSWPGGEPLTLESWVRRPNHSTTEPPCIKHQGVSPGHQSARMSKH